jgi:predicted RNA binding protein YcfA (HicA-like mRNA interferase family)
MSKADDLLDRMRRTEAGWGPEDIGRLYEGFGFDRKEGSNHTIYRHPDETDLRATVPRHHRLATVYARDAVANVEQLLQRKR